ncbi:glycoside hydrolase family 2 protein [Raineyella fluvialis]|uniref:Glycoside hydrolase family 2 n=1 Tax=Raineyella fluvialis TaxID=2662261 RepID=A0A5Q2F7A4_9ACTN|nr:sugar-binding domain-containing protein [Raineyella fluvialis]QGF22872.1 glycoside hydrolase family 2 [Raineyella fluvialis]
MSNEARAAAVGRRASSGDGTYPRPMLVRSQFVALDRRVPFAYDDADEGLDGRWQEDAARFDREIQLPFPPESEASGIGLTDYHPCVWYRIPLTAADLAAAGHAEGRRLLLHFGAVDYAAMVWVDATMVGTHEGGQTPFTFDVTAALDPAEEEHAVVVRAFEDPLDGRMPRGKQDWLPQPHLIWYHRTTGIWRTAWLESVPPLHVERLAWRCDVTTSRVALTVELNRRPDPAVELDVVIALAGRVLASAVVPVEDRVATVTLDLLAANSGVHHEELLWSPERPVLLDAGVAVGEDVVSSYLGIREVTVGPDTLRLNGRRFILRSVLEQGYWPASHLTPPSVEALRDEVQLILSLGFNSARIHQKVEDPRFHFWADRLGLTLWGETGTAYVFDSLAVGRLTREWIDVVRGYESHPSIIAWVPFNESWGVFQIERAHDQQAYVQALGDLTRALDPTRPVVTNDGWEHTGSDLFTIHDYEQRADVLTSRYTAEGVERMLATTGPSDRPLAVGEWAAHLRSRPVLLTEFGGIMYVSTPPDEATWGYAGATSPEDLEGRIRAIMEAVRSAPVLAGYCWTQLTDTLQEANGLVDAGRVPKLPVETLRALMGA